MNDLIPKIYSFFIISNIWILWCFVSLPGFAQNIPAKPELARYANDYAGLLSASDLNLLENKLKGYYDSTSTQIVVVVVNDLGGSKLEDYSHQLAETWGIGQKGKDNGLLILVAQTERQMRIEVGYGLEGLIPDATANHIIQYILQPKFKEGQYFQGLDEASNQIIGYLKGEFKNTAQPAFYKKVDTEGFWKFTGMIFICGIIFATGLIVLIIFEIISSLLPKKHFIFKKRSKLIAHILVFMAAHLAVMVIFDYFNYILIIFLGDMIAGCLTYLIFETDNSSSKSYSSRSRSSSWSSSYSDSSYSDSSSSYSDSSYSDSSSSYSDSSYGGGSFGGGGASGSW
jgi:uncharacterized membrane protein YgcG